jgi:membrane associated rhomboid family serine protease
MDQRVAFNSGRVTDFADKLGLADVYVADGEFWRLLTSGFLHFGLLHLVVNMYSLYALGSNLEQTLGRVRFALLYFAALLAGSFGVVVTQHFGIQEVGLHGGASGAVFGLLGALAVALHQRGVNILKSGLGVTLLINVALTFSLGLSIGGHFGGFIGGAIAGWFMLSPSRQKSGQSIATIVPIAVCIVSVIGSIAVANL